jgi:hypothetical protein
MPKLRLTSHLTNYSNLETAFERVANSSRKDYSYYVWPFIYPFRFTKKLSLTNLSHELRSGLYEPCPAEIEFWPKAGGGYRTISLLRLEDLIVYQALGNIIGFSFRSAQGKYADICSFGNILSKQSSKTFFRPWQISYWTYKSSLEKIAKKKGMYIGIFDIASFYDSVDHAVILNEVKKYCKSTEVEALLSKCLEKWSSRSDIPIRKGMPQGPETSGLLGELLLNRFDQLRYSGCKYFRYVDDIKIFSKDKVRIRYYLDKLELECRKIGLVPQYRKIEIRKVDFKKDAANPIPSAIASLDFSEIHEEDTQDKIRKLLNDSVSVIGGKLCVSDPTKFKFSLTRITPTLVDVRKFQAACLGSDEFSYAYSKMLSKVNLSSPAQRNLIRRIEKSPLSKRSIAYYLQSAASTSMQSEMRKWEALAKKFDNLSPIPSISLEIERLNLKSLRSTVAAEKVLISNKERTAAAHILFRRFVKLGSPFRAKISLSTLIEVAGSKNNDVSRNAALSAGFLFYANCITPIRQKLKPLPYSVRGPLASMGLLSGKGSRDVITTFFDSHNIRIPVKWIEICGNERRNIENKCLDFRERSSRGDYDGAIQALDVFNEALFKRISQRHVNLSAPYKNSIPPKSSFVNWGTWLHHAAFQKEYAKANSWFLDVHNSRNTSPLAHHKAKTTAALTKNMTQQKYRILTKPLSVRWAEIMRTAKSFGG